MTAYNKTDELFKEAGNLLDAAISAGQNDDWMAALRYLQQAKTVVEEMPPTKDGVKK